MTAELKAWWPGEWAKQNFDSYKEAKRPADALATLVFSSVDMTTQGWIHAGSATLTFRKRPESEIVRETIEALRAEQQNLRASVELNCTRIEQRIQSLLAITNEAEPL